MSDNDGLCSFGLCSLHYFDIVGRGVQPGLWEESEDVIHACTHAGVSGWPFRRQEQEQEPYNDCKCVVAVLYILLPLGDILI